MRIFIAVVVCLLSFELHVSGHRTGNIRTGNKLLLLLVDGCRWDYPDQDPELKGFKRIAENGVRAPYMTPIFPTNSYPNWYTLVTGLYAESHGFVNNMMYDSYYNDFFLMGPNETASVAHWWNSAEPLWITAEKNGLRSALFWWDGCQVEIRGRKPSYCRPYKYMGYSWPTVNSDTEDAMKTALDLFENDEIQLVQIYYESVDYNGHKHGPESKERKQAVRNIDALLNWLQTEMFNRGLDEKVNLVVVSDHGMQSTSPSTLNVIDLQDEVNLASIRYMVYYGASSMILPEDGSEDMLFEALRQIGGINVYKKEDIPERYHLKNNRLTLPLLLVANRGYYIRGLDIPGKSIPTGSSISLGSHGYDTYDVPEMRGIFFARGPSFKRGYTCQPLENVDVYNVLCGALGIEALPNNGSRSRTSLLFDYERGASVQRTEFISFTAIIISLLLCLCVYR